MDKPRHNGQLGVNKIGKNIKKTSLHQPNSSNGIVSSRPLPRPQVYNIRKNDSRSFVPQLNPLKPQNTRLQKIRPAASTQMNRSHVPPPVMAQPTHDLAVRPPMQPLLHSSQPMMGHGDQVCSDTAESPVSVYMHYHQSSLGDSGPNGNQMHPSHEFQSLPQVRGHHSPRFNGSASSVPILPTPRLNGLPQQMFDNSLPPPRFNGRGILPSPTSQYLLQSPTAHRNLLSPRSPYPLLSPQVRCPPPLKPRSFTLSSTEPGILGPGTIPQSPTSLDLVFPSSPSNL